jgi:uncharacterized protein YndB with AHSA1/START domain
MSTIEAIISEIIINAPAQRVFDALVNPQERIKWWGREGRFQTTEMESDLRPGGAWIMHGTREGGKTFTLRGQYRAIDPPRLLEFSFLEDWEDKIPPTIVRFDLNERAGSTTVRLTHFGFAAQADRDRYQGWPWLLSLLQGHVEKKGAK